MTQSLLSQPLSPTPAKGTPARLLRSLALAFFLALFVLLLGGDAANADEAVDVASQSSDAPAQAATDEADPAPAAPTPSTPRAEPADEPAPAQAVAAPVPARVAVTEVAPARSRVEVDVVDAVDAAPAAPAAAAPATAAPERRVPAGFVQATLVRHQAHSAPAVHQCNADTYPTSAGWEASCTVTVENTLGGDGATSSRVTTTWCLAEAGVLPPEGCTTDVTTSDSLVTTVDQCNGILAGGSNVTCRVEVVNTVPEGTATTEVTVHQCVGSGQGGVSPGGPPTDCDPVDSSTTGATVTQCNGSANGGGGPERVQCSVTAAGSALPVTVNQCNGSTAAGSTVTCDVTYTNNFTAAAAPDVPATTPITPTPTLVPVAADTGGPTPASTSTSSARSVTSLSTGTATAVTLPATGPATTSWLLLTVAMLLLALGSLLLAAARRPATA